MSESLSLADHQELERCEAVIERGFKTFVEVGAALLRIRDARLYRATYGTFDDYCRERWSMTDRRARQLMSAAAVVSNVESGTIVPATESQARPLATLEPEQQREAWTKAVETAPDRKLTAAHVTAVVEDLFPRRRSRPAKGQESGRAAGAPGEADVKESFHRPTDPGAAAFALAAMFGDHAGEFLDAFEVAAGGPPKIVLNSDDPAFDPTALFEANFADLDHPDPREFHYQLMMLDGKFSTAIRQKVLGKQIAIVKERMGLPDQPDAKLIRVVDDIVSESQWKRHLNGEPKTWDRFCSEVLGFDAEFKRKVEGAMTCMHFANR